MNDKFDVNPKNDEPFIILSYGCLGFFNSFRISKGKLGDSCITPEYNEFKTTECSYNKLSSGIKRYLTLQLAFSYQTFNPPEDFIDGEKKMREYIKEII